MRTVGLASLAFTVVLSFTSTFAFGQSYRIAFGSCNKSDKPQTHWETIYKAKPDVWVWLGDIVYLDGLTPAEQKASFDVVKNSPFYSKLRMDSRVVGVWDDHDFGVNNGNYKHKSKRLNQKLLLDFLDVPAADPRRKRDGVYTRHLLGEKGEIELLLLDTRFFKGESFGYQMLGKDQWRWLESHLKRNGPRLTIIGSSVHVMSSFRVPGLEGFSEFRSEQRKLLSLAAKTKRPVMFISGDRHFAEFSQTQVHGKNIFEFMSSGLTHTFQFAIPNPQAVSPAIKQRNYGLIDIDFGKGTVSVHSQVYSFDKKKVVLSDKRKYKG